MVLGVRKWCISLSVLHVVLNVSVMNSEPALWAMEYHQEPHLLPWVALLRLQMSTFGHCHRKKGTKGAGSLLLLVQLLLCFCINRPNLTKSCQSPRQCFHPLFP